MYETLDITEERATQKYIMALIAGLVCPNNYTTVKSLILDAPNHKT